MLFIKTFLKHDFINHQKLQNWDPLYKDLIVHLRNTMLLLDFWKHQFLCSVIMFLYFPSVLLYFNNVYIEHNTQIAFVVYKRTILTYIGILENKLQESNLNCSSLCQLSFYCQFQASEWPLSQTFLITKTHYKHI